jgi:hypothetical protein
VKHKMKGKTTLLRFTTCRNLKSRCRGNKDFNSWQQKFLKSDFV